MVRGQVHQDEVTVLEPVPIVVVLVIVLDWFMTPEQVRREQDAPSMNLW